MADVQHRQHAEQPYLVEDIAVRLGNGLASAQGGTGRFRIVRDNMAGGERKTTDRLIPHVMFTDPTLVHVGLSGGEARRPGIPVRVAKPLMRNVLRTETTDETDGFMKVLVEAKDDRLPRQAR